jgi:2-(1,2-epoxy-1,2-dihydrophenyl)acetyl-CoA isomerase
MRLLKRALYAVPDLTFAQAGDDVATKTAITDHHPDAREGQAAFLEKRVPRFNAALEGKKPG